MASEATEDKKYIKQLKKMAKLEEKYAKEKERTQKLKTVLAELKGRKALRRSPGAPRAKRPHTVWVKALQEWNQGKESYRIPKKGSAEYDEVTAIKQKMTTELLSKSAEKLDAEMKAALNDNPPYDEMADDGSSATETGIPDFPHSES